MSNFTSNLSSWDVSKVINMAYMFNGASNFNSNLSGWDVSKVTSMGNMFYGATNFNQDLSAWDVSQVTDMTLMFNGAGLSTYNYNSILDAWSKQAVQTSVSLGASPTQYGGCELNGPIGIAGRNKLMSEKSWTITDGGPASLS